MKKFTDAVIAGDISDVDLPNAATVWLSPLDDCNVCHTDLDTVMYDAALPGLGGAWGNVCQGCFSRYGGALGIGRGQRYELQPLGSKKAWVGTEGFD